MMKRRPVEIDQVSWGGKEGGRDSGRGVGTWREVSWREGRTGTSSGIGMERGVNEALPVGKTRREGGRMEVESGGEGKKWANIHFQKSKIKCCQIILETSAASRKFKVLLVGGNSFAVFLFKKGSGGQR